MKKIKNTVDNIYWKVFFTYMKYGDFKKINKKIKGNKNIKKLTSEEKEKTKKFWTKYTKSINLKWHIWYRTCNRIF